MDILGGVLLVGAGLSIVAYQNIQILKRKAEKANSLANDLYRISRRMEMVRTKVYHPAVLDYIQLDEYRSLFINVAEMSLYLSTLLDGGDGSHSTYELHRIGDEDSREPNRVDESDDFSDEFEGEFGRGAWFYRLTEHRVYEAASPTTKAIEDGKWMPLPEDLYLAVETEFRRWQLLRVALDGGSLIPSPSPRLDEMIRREAVGAPVAATVLL